MTDPCLVTTPHVNRIVQATRYLLQECKVPWREAYKETGQGDVSTLQRVSPLKGAGVDPGLGAHRWAARSVTASAHSAWKAASAAARSPAPASPGAV